MEHSVLMSHMDSTQFLLCAVNTKRPNCCLFNSVGIKLLFRRKKNVFSQQKISVPYTVLGTTNSTTHIHIDGWVTLLISPKGEFILNQSHSSVSTIKVFEPKKWRKLYPCGLVRAPFIHNNFRKSTHSQSILGWQYLHQEMRYYWILLYIICSLTVKHTVLFFICVIDM